MGQGFHLKLSNQPDVVARLACCDVNMPNFDGLPIEVQAPEARFEVAVYELLLSEPNILASRLLFQCNTMVPNLIFLRILRAAACSCLKEQKERIMYGTTSPQEVRCVPMSVVCNSTDSLLYRPIFLLNQPVFAHHCLTLVSLSTSPLSGSANAFLNRSPNHFPFPLLPHASSALLFSLPRSKPQSGT